MTLQQAGNSPAIPQGAQSILPLIRGPIWAGLLVVLLFFGLFGGWAALAPLSSGALAPGVVSPESSRKVIQHFEGGIIAAINVREGQQVAAGDTLLTLDPKQAEASFASSQAQWLRLLVTRARLSALVAGSDEMLLPDDALHAGDPDIQAFIANQKNLFSAQRSSQAQQADIVARQVAQLESQIGGLRSAIASQKLQRELIEADLGETQQLLSDQLVSRRQVTALQREAAELDSIIATNQAAAASASQSIEEARLELLRSKGDFSMQVARETSEVNNQIAILEQDMTNRRDVLRRTGIVSPVDGIVLNMRNHTVGGVIAPGEAIMDVVPQDDALVILARLAPKDIDLVTVGLRAQVVLQPFASLNALPLIGEVVQVDADSTFDEATRQSHYTVRVRVPTSELAKHEDMYMAPGMPADVTVVTGARTMLQYLAEPLMRSIRTAFIYD